jgi:hypothetical protein
MATILPRDAHCRAVLSFMAGLLVVGGLALLLRPTASAQTKDKGKKDRPAPEKPVNLINDVLVPGTSGVDQVPFINQELEKLWKANKVEPAPRCTDYEFIRRASLDIIGRIAKVEEIDRFLKDPERERRSLLIERLLASDEYAQHFADVWTTMLLTRSSGRIYKEQMNLWLFEQLQKKDADWSKITTDILTATGDTDDNGAANFILAHLGEEIPAAERNADGRFQMVPVTSRTTKVFLGLRVQCTQCHDHPFNDEWKQSHFWGVNAFFRQVDAPMGRPGIMMKKGTARNRLKLVDNPDFNKKGLINYERRSGVVLASKQVFLDGQRFDPKSPLTRRQQLTKFIITSPYFGKVFVNRYWGHFFGRGLFTTSKEVDDFGEHNPIVLPDMLDRLTTDWTTKYQHNPRDLVRWICNSKAYGLASVANKSNISADAEPFFSRMLLKAMSPEQLFESLTLATQSKAAANSEARKKQREEWLTKLVQNFGDDEGSEITFNGTVVQALMLMNGKEINDAIMDKDYGTVAKVVQKYSRNPQAAMASLYLTALNRPPAKAEIARILSSKMITMPKVRPPKTAQEQAEFYAGFYQDLYWAILNSNEFYLNH